MRHVPYLRIHGPRLQQLGYPIVPIAKGTKYPAGLSDWRNVEATSEALENWLSNGFADGGVGIRTGEIVGADIDIDDADVADAMRSWLVREVGPAPERIGNPPRVLLVYRNREPRAKLASGIWLDETGARHKIEFLGRGQQFVAYAKHPDTGRPYEWPKGGVEGIPVDDLPDIDENSMRAAIAEFERHAAKAGWKPAGDKASTLRDNARPPDPFFGYHQPPVGLSIEAIEEVLARLDPDMGHDQWIRIGMGLHHEFEGGDDGFLLWDGWSASSAKYRESEMLSRWNSFAAGENRHPITFRYAMKLANDAPPISTAANGVGDAQASSENWPELISLEGGELPRLTPDMLGGWLGEYAEALAASTETPFELAACLTLGAVSTAAARRIHSCVKPDYFEPCNLWLLPALAPGNRKSAVEKAAARPLREWEREQAEAMGHQIAQAEAEAEVAKGRARELKAQAMKADDDTEAGDLARQAADIEMNAPQVPKPPQLWTSDATPENLGVLLAAHDERMAWLSAEGGFFEIVGGRYSKGAPNLDLMLKAHAGDPERVNRIGRASVHLVQPLLTIAMSPQPDLLRGLAAKPGFRGRGLLGRFIYFLPPSPLGWRTGRTDPVPKVVEAAYGERLRAMLDWPGTTDEKGVPCLHTVRLSPAAFEAWQAFWSAIERRMRPGGDLENATDWAGKAPGAAVRVAAVLHAADHAGGAPWTVDMPRETMERAIAIVEVSTAHALAVFRLMAADEELAAAEQLWAWVQRHRLRTFRLQQAWQGLKGSKAFSKAADVKAALERLAERGYVALAEEHRGKSGGRVSVVVSVRPELSEGWD